MTDYTITIRMRGDDQLSTVVKGVSSEVQNLGNKSKEAGEKSSGLKDAIGRFKSELMGIGTAYGVVKLAQFIGDMNELGMQVNAARNTFTELSGGAADAASNLEFMRQSTRGVVDDMTLMNAANRLLLMGLATTGDEAAKLAGGAVALGKAMGQDAQTAVEGFAALLANQSIPRLDNFGISAANVRVKIQELKDAGYGIEDAFRLAVLDEMENSLDKLGGSLDANATSFERWGTRIQNTTQDVGSSIAAGFEGIALAAEVITGQDAGHQHLKRVAAEQAAAYVGTFVEQMNSRGIELQGSVDDAQQVLEDMMYLKMTGGNPLDALTQGQAGIRAFGEDVALGTTALSDFNVQAAFMGVTVQQATDEAAAGAQKMADRIGSTFAGLEDQTISTSPLASTFREASDEMDAFFEAQGRQRAAVSTLSSIVDTASFQYHRWSQIGATAFQTLTVMGQRWQAAQNSLAGSMGTIGAGFTALGLNPADFGTQMMDFQLPQMSGFVSSDELTQMTSLYQNAQLELQNIQSLAAQGLIPQTEVDKAQNMVNNFGTMVGQMQTIKQLSDITGQTGGGIMGELGNIVMGQAGASGMAQEQIDALERQINLASGAETVTSVALETQAAPLILAIAEQVGPEAAAAALQSLNEQMQNAKLEGLGQEQIAAMIPQMTGYQMNAAGMVSQIPQMMMGMMSAGGPMIDEGLDATGAPGAGGAPMSMSGEMTALQESLPIVSSLMLPIQDASAATATSFSAIHSSMTGTIAASEELRGRLDTLEGDRFVKVHIEPVDPSGVLGLLNSAASFAQTVRDNGGSVPGRDSRIPE